MRLLRSRLLLISCAALALLLLPLVCLNVFYFWAGGVNAGDFQIQLVGDFGFYRNNAREQGISGPSRVSRGDDNGTTPTWIFGQIGYIGWNDQIIVCQLLGPNNTLATEIATGGTGESWWVIDVRKETCAGPLKADEARAICREHGLQFDRLKHHSEYRPR